MAFVGPRGTQVITVPSGQSVAIGYFGAGSANVYQLVASPNHPNSIQFLQAVSNGVTVLGPFANGGTLTIDNGPAELEYAIGASITASALTKVPIVPGTGTVQAFTDTSGAPGAATINTPRGRFAFAATSGAAGIVITNPLCVATSTVLVTLAAGDATAFAARATPGAGSFTVATNANTTGITKCDFTICN